MDLAGAVGELAQAQGLDATVTMTGTTTKRDHEKMCGFANAREEYEKDAKKARAEAKKTHDETTKTLKEREKKAKAEHKEDEDSKNAVLRDLEEESNDAGRIFEASEELLDEKRIAIMNDAKTSSARLAAVNYVMMMVHNLHEPTGEPPLTIGKYGNVVASENIPKPSKDHPALKLPFMGTVSQRTSATACFLFL